MNRLEALIIANALRNLSEEDRLRMARETRISEDQVRRKCVSCRENFWGMKTELECPVCLHKQKDADK